MIPDFTGPIENYILKNPQAKKISRIALRNLIKGLGRMAARIYMDGFRNGKAHGAFCDCVECRKSRRRRRSGN